MESKNVDVVMEGENVEMVQKEKGAGGGRMSGVITSLLFLCVFLLVLTGIAYAYVKIRESKLKQLAEVPPVRVEKAKKTPLPLPQGPQTYRYSHGKDVLGPKPQMVQLSTIDPGLNGKQKIEVTIIHDSPVTEAAVNLMTDNKVERHLLTRISGTDMNGVWEGEWVVDDTYLDRFFLQFDLKSKNSSYKDGLSFR